VSVHILRRSNGKRLIEVTTTFRDGPGVSYEVHCDTCNQELAWGDYEDVFAAMDERGTFCTWCGEPDS
jgi:hypothetical protein